MVPTAARNVRSTLTKTATNEINITNCQTRVQKPGRIQKPPAPRSPKATATSPRPTTANPTGTTKAATNHHHRNAKSSRAVPRE